MLKYNKIITSEVLIYQLASSYIRSWIRRLSNNLRPLRKLRDGFFCCCFGRFLDRIPFIAYLTEFTPIQSLHFRRVDCARRYRCARGIGFQPVNSLVSEWLKPDRLEAYPTKSDKPNELFVFFFNLGGSVSCFDELAKEKRLRSWNYWW